MCQQYKTEASMTKHNILFIGLDTHKTFTEVAYIEDQRGAKPIHLGKILSNKTAFKKLARKLQSKYPDATLHFVYEAGPCGFERFVNLEKIDVYESIINKINPDIKT